MPISVSVAGRNAGLDGVAGLIDGGVADSYIRFYDGAMPANVTVTLSGNTVLAESTMAATAFTAAAAAAVTANAIGQVGVAQSGTITFFRIFDGDGNAVIQGNAGDVGTEDCVIDEATVVQSGNFNVTALSITQPLS